MLLYCILYEYISVTFDNICASKISIHFGIRDPAAVGFNASSGSITCQGEEFQKKKERKIRGKNR
jgi:hypothetical protein